MRFIAIKEAVKDVVECPLVPRARNESVERVEKFEIESVDEFGIILRNGIPLEWKLNQFFSCASPVI